MANDPDETGGTDPEPDDDPAATAEQVVQNQRDEVRAMWDMLRREGLKQKEVREILVEHQRRIPDAKDRIPVPSTSYISQILTVPKKGEAKNASTRMLRAITLALNELVARHQADISTDRIEVIRPKLVALQRELDVDRAVWQDGEAPLPPGALNALERTVDRQLDALLVGSPESQVIGIRGGPRVGKTTTLLRAQARCRAQGHRVLYADVAALYSRSRQDEARFWRLLVREFEIGDDVDDQFGFEDAFDAWMADDPSAASVVVMLDGINALLEVGQPEWATQAVALFTRHLIQASRTSPAGEAMSRYNVVTAQSFAVVATPRPTLQSDLIIATATLYIEGLSVAETRVLLDRHAAHLDHPDPADAGAVATQVQEFFGGQPMLVQDALAHLMASPERGNVALALAEPTVLASRFVDHLRNQVHDVVERVVVDGRPLHASTQALTVLALVEAGRWTAPYLSAWLAPRLEGP